MELLNLLERSRSTIHPGLERMQAALEELGMHQTTLVPSILIGGTNGKGSTAGCLWRLLALSGVRCGLYTSPHVVHFQERIQISDREITLEYLEEELVQVRSRLSSELYETLSFFELTTLLAFVVFQRNDCELMILEVGLGGRWDATNLVEPLASIVVSIDFDHQEWLGTSLASIAREKLGIARKDKVLFWGDQVHRAELQTVLSEARAACPFLLYTADTIFGVHEAKAFVRLPSCVPWHYEFPTWLDGRASIFKHNFALAAAVYYWLLHEDFFAHRIASSQRQTFAAATLAKFDLELSPWPFSFLGRMQKLQVLGSKTKTWDFYLDVCHNIASVQEFVRTLEAKGLAVRNRKKIAGFVSILRDKDIDPMLTLLREVLDPFVLFKIDHKRSITEDRLAQYDKDLVIYDDFAELWKVYADCVSSPVVICGSFYAVGRVIDYFKAYPQAFFGQSTLHASDPRHRLPSDPSASPSC